MGQALSSPGALPRIACPQRASGRGRADAGVVAPGGRARDRAGVWTHAPGGRRRGGTAPGFPGALMSGREWGGPRIGLPRRKRGPIGRPARWQRGPVLLYTACPRALAVL